MYYFKIFWPYHEAYGILVPQPETNLVPCNGVLIIELPENSLRWTFNFYSLISNVMFPTDKFLTEGK